MGLSLLTAARSTLDHAASSILDSIVGMLVLLLQS